MESLSHPAINVAEKIWVNVEPPAGVAISASTADEALAVANDSVLGAALRPSQRHLPRTKRLLQLLISLFMPGIKEQTFLAHFAIQIVHL